MYQVLNFDNRIDGVGKKKKKKSKRKDKRKSTRHDNNSNFGLKNNNR